jgi:hypothetical protein
MDQSATFITGMSRKVRSDAPGQDEIKLYFGQLTGMIDQLDDQVSEVIKCHEKEFFSAFKNRMFDIKQEMEELKTKASGERLKAK